MPVVNENDTVATQELRYGDNDRLAARVAQMVSADCLVLLSDVDGLYTADPRRDASARYVDEVTELTRELLDMAGGPGSSHGSGGMRTKLEAARIAVGAGCRMCIATRPRRAADQRAAARAARPRGSCRARHPGAARKQWIAGTLKPKGTLRVDAGAERALVVRAQPAAGRRHGRRRASSSAATRSACVAADGRELARGLTAYPADEAALIAGRRSRRHRGVLGYSGRDEIIHRDDLVLLGAKQQS